jgi:hypothetical protein
MKGTQSDSSQKVVVRLVAAAVLIGSVFSVANASPADELPKEWKHWSHFRGIDVPPPADDAEASAPASKLVRVALPEALFKHGRSDLADLRVLDERGEDVGFVIFDRDNGRETEWRSTERVDAGFVPGEYTQVVADTGEGDALHNRVQVTLPPAEEEFFTWVEVAASQDGKTWRVVSAKAPLYRFGRQGFGRTHAIQYPRTRDRFLRLRLLESEVEIDIERLRVAEKTDNESEMVDIRRALVRNPDSPEGESWWEPNGPMSEVPIAAIRVETASEAFHRPVKVSVSEDRQVWDQVGEGIIYRYRAEESSPGDEPGTSRQSLQVDVRNTASPFWRATILDRSDPPVTDLEVVLMQSQRYLVFRPSAGSTYRLAYGNPKAEAPEYEIAELTSRDSLAGARLAELGDEQTNETWTSSEPFSERHPVMLWMMLGLAILVLGSMALRALRT